MVPRCCASIGSRMAAVCTVEHTGSRRADCSREQAYRVALRRRMTALGGGLNRSTQHPRLLRAGVEVSGFRAAWIDRDSILQKHD